MRPEPDLDGIAGPFHGVYPTSVVVETIAVRLRSSTLDAAALITEAVLVHQRAARAGVHGHGVLIVVVNTFNDVNFSAGGPFCSLA